MSGNYDVDFNRLKKKNRKILHEVFQNFSSFLITSSDNNGVSGRFIFAGSTASRRCQFQSRASCSQVRATASDGSCTRIRTCKFKFNLTFAFIKTTASSPSSSTATAAAPENSLSPGSPLPGRPETRSPSIRRRDAERSLGNATQERRRRCLGRSHQIIFGDDKSTKTENAESSQATDVQPTTAAMGFTISISVTFEKSRPATILQSSSRNSFHRPDQGALQPASVRESTR